mgnify:CR=1 FL=1
MSAGSTTKWGGIGTRRVPTFSPIRFDLIKRGHLRPAPPPVGGPDPRAARAMAILAAAARRA